MAEYNVPSDRKNYIEKLLVEYVKGNENFTNAWFKSKREGSSLKGRLVLKFLEDGTLDLGFEKENPSGQKKYDFNVGKNFGDYLKGSVGFERVTPQYGKHLDTYSGKLESEIFGGKGYLQGSTTGGDKRIGIGWTGTFDEGGFVEAPVEQQLASVEHDPKKIDIFSNLETEIGTWALKPLLDMGVNEDKLRKVLDNETNHKDPLPVRLQQKNKKGSSATGLFQFTERTANWLGTSTKEIAKMSLPEQVLLYKKYLEKWGWKKGTPLAMMQAAPAYANKPDDFIVYTERGNPEAYKKNLVWVPKNKKGKRIKGAPITVRSIKAYYDR